MQVQLIVANENRKGQEIPVNVPSFTIGRAEGCNLRSRSQQVSRNHCTIYLNNDTVVVQDLGGENGTFVNGSKISTSQELKDGDKLIVGTHSFVVSIKTGVAQPNADQGDFFELTPSSTGQIKPKQAKPKQGEGTRPVDPMKTVAIEAPKQPPQKTEIMFEIRLNGQRVSVTKSRLFDLARKGSVLPDDLITIDGTKVFADSIQGIVFGEQAPAPPTSPSPQTASAVRPPTATPPTAAPTSDPFAFPDLGNVADEAHPFHDVVSEPFVQVARRESAFGALWKALDISFSRVYTIEGNNLVIHSIKALYYVLVVSCFLIFFLYVLQFCTDWYEKGEFLTQLNKHAVGLASVTFGVVTIVVIVRVLLEMLLLAWVESAHAEQKEKEE